MNQPKERGPTLGKKTASSGEAAPAEDPDLPALKRVLAGDADAYGEVVERHGRALHRLIQGLIADSHLAEDVVQEVFLIAYRRLPTFRFKARFKTWLTKIAVREGLGARSRWRRLVKRVALLDEGASQDPEEERPDPGQWAEGRDEALAILRELPDHERATFVLFAEGWAYADISQILACPMGTVATRIRRARQRLARGRAAVDGAEPPLPALSERPGELPDEQ